MKILNYTIALSTLISSGVCLANSVDICQQVDEKMNTYLEVNRLYCEEMSESYLTCASKSLKSMQDDFVELDYQSQQKYLMSIHDDCSDDEHSVQGENKKNNQVKVIADFNFSSNQEYDGQVIGGLSGVSYDDSTKVLTAISDDFGRYGVPRIYQFELTNTKNDYSLNYKQTINLKDKDGVEIPYRGYQGGFDAEGIIDLGNNDGFMTSTETFFDNSYFHHVKNGQIIGKMTTPYIYRPHEIEKYENLYSSTGIFWKPVPQKPSGFCRFLGFFGLSEWGCGVKKIGNTWKEKIAVDKNTPIGQELKKYTGGGLQHNLGFEGLGISPDKNYIFATSERELLQDNPRYVVERDYVSPWNGNSSEENLVRITRYARKKGYRNDTFSMETRKEFLYKYDSHKGNGVSEILGLSKDKALVMERGFDSSTRVTTIKIYEANLFGAKDIKDYKSLVDVGYTQPVPKRLIAKLNDIEGDLSAGFRMIDNYEAMTLGPKLSNGKASLILATDNNFRDRQLTQILILELPYSYRSLFKDVR